MQNSNAAVATGSQPVSAAYLNCHRGWAPDPRGPWFAVPSAIAAVFLSYAPECFLDTQGVPACPTLVPLAVPLIASIPSTSKGRLEQTRPNLQPPLCTLSPDCYGPVPLVSSVPQNCGNCCFSSDQISDNLIVSAATKPRGSIPAPMAVRFIDIGIG